MTERQKKFALKRLNDDVQEVALMKINDSNNKHIQLLRIRAMGMICMANYVGLITDDERKNYEDKIAY